MTSALDAAARRRSHSRVTDDAPSHEELLPLVAAAGRVADHSSLEPWRIIELRGDARNRLGAALAKGAHARGSEAEKLAAKPLRASLLLAIVVSHHPSRKVAKWEQSAVASGVAHTLSLLLDEAGWGVFWRTGEYTRTKPVEKMHGLAKNEQLLGWLYVGGVPERDRETRVKTVDAAKFLTVLD
ncbi:nitroreductase family protein [Compostimonas suwonensis]|uniref:Putative NAD(P)H nitroreductase n=1 Tax=Compostimonas suwonensis TaxID=1048394 RepID=A0A2M9BVI5_9MICO|nr:nitroreductase family protein [Compostimonas suwonensis]PJJ61963.1 nitroreductase [Compostimonas suwonensis]